MISRRLARTAAVALAPALALAVCAGGRVVACRAGEDLVVADTPYVGTNAPAGVVSEDEWPDFLANGVTPRFPQGITSWRASGQWRSTTGALERAAFEVLQLFHADAPAHERAVREVTADDRKRFEGEIVPRVRLPAGTSFRSPNAARKRRTRRPTRAPRATAGRGRA